MKIVFIGAGNLATNLALEISQSEHQIVQVFSRTWESASLLAEKVNCGLDDTERGAGGYGHTGVK